MQVAFELFFEVHFDVLDHLVFFLPCDGAVHENNDRRFTAGGDLEEIIADRQREVTRVFDQGRCPSS